jgi:hypothetical protein
MYDDDAWDNDEKDVYTALRGRALGVHDCMMIGY